MRKLFVSYVSDHGYHTCYVTVKGLPVFTQETFEAITKHISVRYEDGGTVLLRNVIELKDEPHPGRDGRGVVFRKNSVELQARDGRTKSILDDLPIPEDD